MASHRPRRSAAQWRELIAEQLRSGLSAKQFCAENDLGYPSFQNWKNKLSAERSAEAAAPDPQAAFKVRLPLLRRASGDSGEAAVSDPEEHRHTGAPELDRSVEVLRCTAAVPSERHL